ncbi:MAG: glycosyl hydrolase family 5 [Proteobacteria bacterium]|nr:glycosyl hydrolase family 5 [Pseudomonadota bacterium]
MRALILSSLFAIGLGLAAAPAANATPISAINGAVAGQSMVDQAQYYYRPRYRARCRSVRVCRWTPYGRRCHWERVCRRW